MDCSDLNRDKLRQESHRRSLKATLRQKNNYILFNMSFYNWWLNDYEWQLFPLCFVRTRLPVAYPCAAWIIIHHSLFDIHHSSALSFRPRRVGGEILKISQSFLLRDDIWCFYWDITYRTETIGCRIVSKYPIYFSSPLILFNKYVRNSDRSQYHLCKTLYLL
jgi:hypothetical protein